jgi:hypothetical protein
MKLRVARHTAQLQPLVSFYQLLGLQVLGGFTNHSGYDGVFMGLPAANWHLEFTTSGNDPAYQPNEDDLLVFYPDTKQEYWAILDALRAHGIWPVKPLNPYWRANGTAYMDPDGYGVIIVAANL